MIENSLPNNMTLEDFERLAERQPNLAGHWIYRITRTVIDRYNVNKYPFDLLEDEPIWFLSFEEAQNHIKGMACNDEDDEDETYCYHIMQIPLGSRAVHGAQWLFDSNGDLLDFVITTCSGDVYDTTFFGRPKNRFRFNRGDIVEIICGGQVKLAVVVENPPSIDWCWSMYKDSVRNSMPYIMHASHDCCYLVDGPGYDYNCHISPMLIMKPRFPIPTSVEKEMKGWLKYLDEDI